jgi:hypothetical protein
MAIINSIVMGKSKGKIGNVVTTTLKGQVIAKSRNYSPANPKTDLQISSRAKMSNAVKAWQFLALFLTFTKPFAKSTESTYNAFVSASKNLFESIVVDFGYQAANLLQGMSLFVSQIATVAGERSSANSLTVNITPNGINYSPTLHIRAKWFDNVTGNTEMSDRVVTLLEYNANTLDLDVVSNEYTDIVIYLYDASNSKCSNVAFCS